MQRWASEVLTVGLVMGLAVGVAIGLTVGLAGRWAQR
jgi:hypothetical protein